MQTTTQMNELCVYVSLCKFDFMVCCTFVFFNCCGIFMSHVKFSHVLFFNLCVVFSGYGTGNASFVSRLPFFPNLVQRPSGFLWATAFKTEVRAPQMAAQHYIKDSSWNLTFSCKCLKTLLEVSTGHILSILCNSSQVATNLSLLILSVACMQHPVSKIAMWSRRI